MPRVLCGVACRARATARRAWQAVPTLAHGALRDVPPSASAPHAWVLRATRTHGSRHHRTVSLHPRPRCTFDTTGASMTRSATTRRRGSSAPALRNTDGAAAAAAAGWRTRRCVSESATCACASSATRSAPQRAPNTVGVAALHPTAATSTATAPVVGVIGVCRQQHKAATESASPTGASDNASQSHQQQEQRQREERRPSVPAASSRASPASSSTSSSPLRHSPTTRQRQEQARSLAEGHPRITIVGVGGGGGNAINNMISSSLSGVEFLVANTDAQALNMSLTERRLQLGTAITEGLGAGARPDVGRAAAEESMEQLTRELAGSNMVFVTAGMGGGTGSGAAPVIARAASELGSLTVGVVTKPFHFEGAYRAKMAELGIAELSQCVDTLIVIPNQNLFKIATANTTMLDAFRMADQVLYSGVRSVTDLMTVPGLINLDFADVRSVMNEMGKAMMGTGEAQMDGGEERATRAAEAAIQNPLLDETSLRGARGVLVNITGGPDMTLFEVDAAAHRIREEVDQEANIIFGSTYDEAADGKLCVSVVATGIP